MLQADGDLMNNTRCTNRSTEADKWQPQENNGAEPEACEDTCQILNEEPLEPERWNC